MKCAFCRERPAVRVNRIGRVLKLSCGTCVWKHGLAVKFDGYNLTLRGHLVRKGKKSK